MVSQDQLARTNQQSAQEPRTAILVLGCVLTVYDRCIKIIRATWGAKSVDNIDVFYVYGGQDATTREPVVDLAQLLGRALPRLQDGEIWASGDIILCGATDLREGQANCILRKRLIAFDYLANQRGYDFVYAVCASSYVDVEGLQRYVASLPRSGVYHGALFVHDRSGYPFVSGASCLLSRDIAGDLGHRAGAIVSAYPEEMADDVVIGHFIADKYCREPIAEISRRIAVAQKPTDNQTFVMPFGHGSVDFVMAPAYSQVPREPSYHFHFHSRRMWEMENFHRRFFTGGQIEEGT